MSEYLESLTPKQQAEYKRNLELKAMKEEAQSKLDFCDEAALKIHAACIEGIFKRTAGFSPSWSYSEAQRLWEERQRFVAAEKQRVKALEDEIIRRNQV